MSDGMSEYLAAFYGTNGTLKTASAEPEEEEDLVKRAQVELFCKVATEQNIDLMSMPDASVEKLFSNFINNTKTAAEDSEPAAEPDLKVEEAAKELEQKKEAAAEFAKYDFFGRQMAHAYVDELKKIAAAEGPGEEEKGDEPEEEGEKAASVADHARAFAGKVKSVAGKGYDKAKGSRPVELLSGSKKKSLHGGLEAARKAHSHADAPETASRLQRAFKEHKSESGKVLKARIGAGVGGGAAAAGGGAAAYHHREKKGSAIDELSLEAAIIKAAEAGFDVDEAAERVAAVLTLGLEESTKIASANDVEGAVEVRSLEILEAAGYPVTWAA